MSLPPPYYYRDLNYRYCLFSAPAYGWWTGFIRGDLQLYLGPTAVILFDRDGNFVRTEDKSFYKVPNEWRMHAKPCPQAARRGRWRWSSRRLP